MLLKKMGLWFPALMFVAALVTAQGSAQDNDAPKLPDTDAGRRVAVYLKAFNSGDEQAVRQFFVENVSAVSLAQRPLDARLGIYRQMHDNMGTIDATNFTSKRYRDKGVGANPKRRVA